MEEMRGWRGVRRWAITVSMLSLLVLSVYVEVVGVVIGFGVFIEAEDEVMVDGVKIG